MVSEEDEVDDIDDEDDDDMPRMDTLTIRFAFEAAERMPARWRDCELPRGR